MKNWYNDDLPNERQLVIEHSLTAGKFVENWQLTPLGTDELNETGLDNTTQLPDYIGCKLLIITFFDE